MKRYNLIFMLAAVLLTGCSKKDGETADEMVPVEGVEISLGGMTTSGATVTRSVDDFAVNTSNDPTHSMTPRQGWFFDLQIYNGDNPFTPYGVGIMQWSSGAGTWLPVLGRIGFIR